MSYVVGDQLSCCEREECERKRAEMEEIERKKMAKEQEMEEVLPETVNSMSSTLVKLTVRLLLPAGSLIFTIIFWVVGLIASFYSGADQDSNMYDCLVIDLN